MPTSNSTQYGARKAVSIAETEIRIRCYNVGFGDCFLLSFLEGESKRNILIDFGCMPGQSRAAFASIIENIYEETGGHLDVVVVTNEHLDHLGGFLQQAQAFKKFQVDFVWMGLTSEPSYLEGSLLADLRASVGNFYSWIKESKTSISPAFETLILNNLRTEAHLEAVTSLVSDESRVLYLNRGDSVVGQPFSNNVLVEVLAPESNFDAYENANDDFDLYDAMQELNSVKDRLESRLDCKNKERHPIFSERKFKNVNCVDAPANLSHFDWRILREKNAGFGVSEMREIDTAIGNTSLALLLTIHGKKLLFPGDAQWASWDWMSCCVGCSESEAFEEDCPGCKQQLEKLESVDLINLSKHGNRSGAPADLFESLKPSTKIVATTRANVYGTKHAIPDEKLFGALHEKHGDDFIVIGSAVDGLWVDAKL